MVFGDIGTSPLYTVQTCFSDFTGLKPTPDNVLGILSLITWALIIVVTLKYVVVVMRADNHGEGGVLALMALVSREPGISARRRNVYVILGMLGAALFYGDCLLTPAISVLSAVEGLNVATPAFEPLVLPIAIGRADRPVRHAALRHRRHRPSVRADHADVVRHPVRAGRAPDRAAARGADGASPHHAFAFAMRHKTGAFVALGAVTLALTGAEALYADIGHFGRNPDPRRLADRRVPGPARQLLRPGRAAAGRSRRRVQSVLPLAPDWALYPLVVLATLATVIASQATISGAFSMAQQATLLGLSPRAHIRHTSPSEFGQIYVPAVNWLQLAGVLGIVLAFKTVDRHRLGLRHRRDRHHADHHRAGADARRARLEVAVAAGRAALRSCCWSSTARCSRPT